MKMAVKDRFKALNCCVIVPTYNNDGTLKTVINQLLEYTDDLLVINDGSTDSTPATLESYGDRITTITHEQNQGKGKALRNGFAAALEKGYHYAITIDSDGQHFASDLPAFLDAIEQAPNSLIIGARNMTQENVPGKSNFGNKFSNFWFWVETGIKLTDTQSGYRLYPIQQMKGLRFATSKFEFEIEAIVKAAWRGIKVFNIPIKVHYEPGKKRISHFRPFQDFTRISILNTFLVTLALLYYLPIRFFKSLTKENIRSIINAHFFDKTEPPIKKSLSIGFGVFMGIFPIWGYQMLVGVALAHWMRLNKALVLVASNISIPPLIPFIIYGSYKLGTFFVSDPKDDFLFIQGLSLENIKDNLVQYIIGAIVLAIVAGAVFGLFTYAYLALRRFGNKDA